MDMMVRLIMEFMMAKPIQLCRLATSSCNYEVQLSWPCVTSELPCEMCCLSAVVAAWHSPQQSQTGPWAEAWSFFKLLDLDSGGAMVDVGWG